MGKEIESSGFTKFVRTNPMSDRFKIKRFHYEELWCSDATNVARRFSWALGMQLTAKSDLSTGNMAHASYLISSGDYNFLFTAPYSPSLAQAENVFPTATDSIPTFDHATCAPSSPPMALLHEPLLWRSKTPRLHSPLASKMAPSLHPFP